MVSIKYSADFFAFQTKVVLRIVGAQRFCDDGCVVVGGGSYQRDTCSGI